MMIIDNATVTLKNLRIVAPFL